MDDYTFTLSEGAHRVLRNMLRKVQTAEFPYSIDGLGEEMYLHEAKEFALFKSHMLDTYLRAMDFLFDGSGIRVWPDNGTDECLSLSGVTEYGMHFGIIWRPATYGLGTWTIHT